VSTRLRRYSFRIRPLRFTAIPIAPAGKIAPMQAAPDHPAPITHYENFPVASFLCPAHLRRPIAAIYHFARTADDIADEGDATAAERLDQLQAYRQVLVAACAAHPARHSTLSTDTGWPYVFGPLQQAMATYHLPPQLLHDLLDAFAQDIRKSAAAEGYATHAELLDYCQRSANPVGRLLLHLYGVVDATALLRQRCHLQRLAADQLLAGPQCGYSPGALLPAARRLRALWPVAGGHAGTASNTKRYIIDSTLRSNCEGQHAIWLPTRAPGPRARRVGAAAGSARRAANSGPHRGFELCHPEPAPYPALVRFSGHAVARAVDVTISP
jgi:hypothetical protein